MSELTVSPNSDGAKSIYVLPGADLSERPATPARPMIFEALDTGYKYLWDGASWTFLGGAAPSPISPVRVPTYMLPSGVHPTIFESADPLTIDFHMTFADQDTDQCPDCVADMVFVGVAGSLNGVPVVTSGTLVSYKMIAPNTARVIAKATPPGPGGGIIEGSIGWNTAENVNCVVSCAPYCAASEGVPVTP